MLRLSLAPAMNASAWNPTACGAAASSGTNTGYKNIDGTMLTTSCIGNFKLMASIKALAAVHIPARKHTCLGRSFNRYLSYSETARAHLWQAVKTLTGSAPQFPIQSCHYVRTTEAVAGASTAQTLHLEVGTGALGYTPPRTLANV